jgi:hypothetical protein
MFCREKHGATPFAADGEALDEAEKDERDRGPNADLRVGREEADEGGGKAHQDEAQHQEALPADAIAEMAEDDAADRPRHEAQRIGGEGEEGAGQRLVLREEELVEHERGGRAVEEEIIPFDGGADEAGGDDALEVPAVPGPRPVRRRHPTSPLFRQTLAANPAAAPELEAGARAA